MLRKITLAVLLVSLVMLFAGCAGGKPEIKKPNLALKKPAFASSFEKANQYSGNVDLVAALAVDGDKSTRWGSDWRNDPDPGSAWIYVDLGPGTTFSEVKIFWDNKPNCMATSFNIETSDDASAWTVVKAIRGNGSVDDDIVLDKPVTARYIKINCLKRFSQYGYSIDEFEVY